MRLTVLQVVTYSVVPRLTFTGISSNKSSVLVVYHAGGRGEGGTKMSDDKPFRKTAFRLGIQTMCMRFFFFNVTIRTYYGIC